MAPYERIIWYAEQIYNITIQIGYSADKTIMFIHTPQSHFKIYLKDFERFGYYTVTHKNYFGNGWHKQLRAKSLNYAVYMCSIHDFYKDNNIWSYNFDYERFMNDAYKAYNYDKQFLN